MYQINKKQKYTAWITIFVFAIILRIAKTEVIYNNGTIIETHSNHCECIHNDCGCCEYLEWDAAKINGTFCVNATYLENDYGFSITMTYNSFTIINETVSARNPPPICIGEEFIDNFTLEACLRLYDIDINKTYFHCCFELEGKIAKLTILPLHLGCIKSNNKNSTDSLSDMSLASRTNILQFTAYLSIFLIILSHLMIN